MLSPRPAPASRGQSGAVGRHADCGRLASGRRTARPGAVEEGGGPAGVEEADRQADVEAAQPDRPASRREAPTGGPHVRARLSRERDARATSVNFEERACQAVPQTSSAVSTTRRSFAACSSALRLLPSTVEEKPHCGERQSWSMSA
jgi:hypothetical protein